MNRQGCLGLQVLEESEAEGKRRPNEAKVRINELKWKMDNKHKITGDIFQPEFL